MRVLVKLVRQEDGSCREVVVSCCFKFQGSKILFCQFRKFRSTDRGRSIRLGHKASGAVRLSKLWQDSPELPKWCWRLEAEMDWICFMVARWVWKRSNCQPAQACPGADSFALRILWPGKGDDVKNVKEPEDVFGSASLPGWMRRAKQGETREEDSWGQHLANASLFARQL